MGGALQRLGPHCNRPRSVAPEPPPPPHSMWMGLPSQRAGAWAHYGFRNMYGAICHAAMGCKYVCRGPGGACCSTCIRTIKKNQWGGFSPKNEIRSARAKFPLVLFFRGTPQGFFLGRPVAASFVPPGPGSQTCIHAAILTGKPYLQPYMQPYLPATTLATILATYLQPYVSCYLTPYSAWTVWCCHGMRPVWMQVRLPRPRRRWAEVWKCIPQPIQRNALQSP